MADFLLEIGTEEIPAGMIRDLAWYLCQNCIEAFGREGIWPNNLQLDPNPAHDPFQKIPGGKMIAAPRRIGFLLPGLPERQPDRKETVVGPAMAVARDAGGKWTKAAEGFARKQGVGLEECSEVPRPKGPCIGFERGVKGRETAEILAEIVPAAVDALYLPKAMHWGDGGRTFVRPVRWVVALLDDQLVPLSIKGVAAGRTSRGHRIHGAAEVEIPSPQAYFQALRREHVLADPEDRRRKIVGELEERAAAVGGQAPADPELLEKLVYLCEWPTVLPGAIPEEYLTLPAEILVTCLKEHQSFFVVHDAGGAVMPHFLAVMDGTGDPKGFIRRGLENVSRSRLSDASFFYEHDKAVPLEERLEALKGVVFHAKIGSYYDKSIRLERTARRLAELWSTDAEGAAWAARHCKCDLVSLLVQEKEFTSLQGIAGGLYARAQGKAAGVAEAIYDHYRPAFTDDDLPREVLGDCVAAADRLDTLREMFAAGQSPTGSKDPFALRRSGVALLRILTEKGRLLDLPAFLQEMGGTPEGLEAFLAGRLRFLWEVHGYAYDEANAVLAFGLGVPAELHRKIDALHSIRSEFPEDFDHLSVAFKRARNILKGMPEYPLAPELFLPAEHKEGAGERLLYAAYEAVKDEAGRLLDSRDYAGALRRLSTLRPWVDRFFDDVLVMCDPEGKDPAKTALQNNRLALLQRVVGLFNRVADLSEIVPREG